ncbi:MAG TPA: right-handed parallel beta-helix repeat-containing protein [Chloroflexota bacterium]
MLREKAQNLVECGLVLLLLLLMALPAPAAAQTSCPSLQALIVAAAPGSTITVPPCIFRESVTVTKALTIDGQNQAEIRGADVWSTWNAWQPGDGHTYYLSANAVPYLPWVNDPYRCADRTTNCLQPEQVFIDGKPLGRNFAAGGPVSGQFALDGSRHVILADNPAGHTAEVVTRSFWLRAAAPGVTVKNMTMRFAGDDWGYGAIANGDQPDFVLDHLRLSYAHGDDVRVGGSTATGVKITNSDIAYAAEGIAAYLMPELTITGNHIHDMNAIGYNCDWDCGAGKLANVANLLFDRNEVDHTMTGPWCDIDCTNGTISNNNVHDNSRVGIYVEVSEKVHVTGNTVTNNGEGIGSSTSAGTEIDHNTLSGNGSGIAAFSQARSDAPRGAGTQMYVHDNQISQAANSIALNWYDDGSGIVCAPASNNRGVNNTYKYPSPEGSDVRFGWCAQRFTHLLDFQQTPGGQGGGYMVPVPTATPTMTPVPTRTPVPTLTRTPLPRCQVRIGLRGVNQWRRSC